MCGCRPVASRMWSRSAASALGTVALSRVRTRCCLCMTTPWTLSRVANSEVVGDGDFDEDEVLVVGEVVVVQNLEPFLGVFGLISGVGFVGDESDGASGAVPDEHPCRGVEFNITDP